MMEPEGAFEARPARRRLWMVLLLAGFALISLAGWVRLLFSILNWYWLTYANVAPGPLYLAVTGGLWGLVGLVALAWLWLRRAGFRLVGTAAALFFILTYWADRLLVRSAESAMRNALFAVILTLLILIYILGALRPWQDLMMPVRRQ